MEPPSTLLAVHETLTKAIAVVFPANSKAFAMRLRGDKLRITADLALLRRADFELLCRADRLELRSPQRSYRVPFLGLSAETELTRRCLVVTLKSSAEDAHAPELGRAKWRAMDAAKGSKRIFVTRAINAVADLAALHTARSLDSASAASTDWEVLLRALSSGDATPPSGAEPLAAARLRGVHARQTLLHAHGGTISAPAAARMLGLSRQAVDKRRQAGTLLAVGIGRHGYQYPVWQFEGHGVLKGLDQVLRALARHDDWMKLAFFVNPNVHLDELPPIEVLRRGATERVVAAAERYVHHGAA